jgi:hypothetical protein
VVVVGLVVVVVVVGLVVVVVVVSVDIVVFGHGWCGRGLGGCVGCT